MLAALTTLTLILPQFTTTTPGPAYSSAQLAFASSASLVLYLVFVFVQTVRQGSLLHEAPGALAEASPAGSHPSRATAWMSFAALLLALQKTF